MRVKQTSVNVYRHYACEVDICSVVQGLPIRVRAKREFAREHRKIANQRNLSVSE